MEYSYADLAFDRGRVRIHLCKRGSFVAKVDRNKLACFDAAGTGTSVRLIPPTRSRTSDICRRRARGERSSLAFSASLV
jgi:hypothetical protein